MALMAALEAIIQTEAAGNGDYANDDQHDFIAAIFAPPQPDDPWSELDDEVESAAAQGSGFQPPPPPQPSKKFPRYFAAEGGDFEIDFQALQPSIEELQAVIQFANENPFVLTNQLVFAAEDAAWQHPAGPAEGANAP